MSDIAKFRISIAVSIAVVLGSVAAVTSMIFAAILKDIISSVGYLGILVVLFSAAKINLNWVRKKTAELKGL